MKNFETWFSAFYWCRENARGPVSVLVYGGEVYQWRADGSLTLGAK